MVGTRLIVTICPLLALTDLFFFFLDTGRISLSLSLSDSGQMGPMCEK